MLGMAASQWQTALYQPELIVALAESAQAARETGTPMSPRLGVKPSAAL